MEDSESLLPLAIYRPHIFNSSISSCFLLVRNGHATLLLGTVARHPLPFMAPSSMALK